MLEPVWPSQHMYLTSCSWQVILQDLNTVLLDCSFEVWLQQCSYLCLYVSLNNFAIPQILLLYKNELLMHRSYTTQSTWLPSDQSCYCMCGLFFQALFICHELLCQDILIGQNYCQCFSGMSCFMWINLHSEQVSDENSCICIWKGINWFEC